MPFGESFLSTIKSNKSIMLDKSRRFRKSKGSFDWSKSPQLNLPNSTSEQLEEIRLRLKKENKEIEFKLFIFLVSMAIVLIIAAVYILF
ncbi:hypothetical protein L3X39_09990 [Sabulilitoribacter multivorans]|uniref:Uncharacterized protein n=1 Tax=Flaviramulus multivorans TaxID=1304750 RepID=A0ABS9IK38_9FLAO|nr:hypothetical protein [Flaviramulus multivorans]MCF7560965.1 hypothetical protein [Flaviramulus multivorans]